MAAHVDPQSASGAAALVFFFVDYSFFRDSSFKNLLLTFFFSIRKAAAQALAEQAARGEVPDQQPVGDRSHMMQVCHKAFLFYDFILS